MHFITKGTREMGSVLLPSDPMVRELSFESQRVLGTPGLVMEAMGLYVGSKVTSSEVCIAVGTTHGHPIFFDVGDAELMDGTLGRDWKLSAGFRSDRESCILAPVEVIAAEQRLSSDPLEGEDYDGPMDAYWEMLSDHNWGRICESILTVLVQVWNPFELEPSPDAREVYRADAKRLASLCFSHNPPVDFVHALIDCAEAHEMGPCTELALKAAQKLVHVSPMNPSGWIPDWVPPVEIATP